jgi:hypothetical protein
MNPKISICIPYHDTPDTARFLARSLKSIEEQTFKDYEIVLTKEGPFARNHNAAIMKAKGDIVQMLQMDDYFSYSTSLRTIYDSFQEGDVWQITGSLHDVGGSIGAPHEPEWTDDIYTGNNRLGSVSTLSFRRESALLFEEPLTWVVDCDLYYRFYLKYGLPKLLTSKNVVIDTRTDRLSHTLSDELKAKEVKYLMKKYGK